mmetsp:Transcript_22965/g.52593  ORF Transcript_22965/g.52593 Transcript_22965/m.52593 type:complete len:112 (-) Transcript_22965:60-395(-)
MLHLGSLPHPPALVDFLRAYMEAMDEYELACLRSVTREAKSLLVGVAAASASAKDIDSPLTPEEVIAASRTEEEFQIENWGLVEGGHDLDRLNCSVQVRASMMFLNLLGKN